jgi:hypothetical protein
MDYDLAEDDAFQSRVRDILGLMRPMRVVGHQKKRYGRDWDGGYVILPTVEAVDVVYSLGISDDVSFDLIMANFGAHIFQYDHTVDGPPENHPNFHFHKMGIAFSDDWMPDLRRLDTIVRQNGHQEHGNLFLKMDIEGHEWDTLDVIDEGILQQFDQIVAEFHSFEHLRNSQWFDRAERALKKISKSHQVVHVHGNNNDTFAVMAGIPVPKVIELTWARRDRYVFEETDETFPTELDCRCAPIRPDLILGSFKF